MLGDHPGARLSARMSPSKQTRTITPTSIPTQNEMTPRMKETTPTPTFRSASDADAAMNVRDAAPERSDNAGTTGKRTTPNHHDDLDITL
jgi:hypothetical protein